MLKIDQLDLWYLTALSINFLIIVALIWALGLLKGWLFGVRAVDEITTKGNSAFAVAYGVRLGLYVDGGRCRKFRREFKCRSHIHDSIWFAWSSAHFVG